MFQNIQEDLNDETKEETVEKKNILTNSLSKKNIVLYIVTLMISTISMGQPISPCSLAIIAACRRK